jgi:hypothetical protein
MKRREEMGGRRRMNPFGVGIRGEGRCSMIRGGGRRRKGREEIVCGVGGGREGGRGWIAVVKEQQEWKEVEEEEERIKGHTATISRGERMTPPF